MGHRTGTPIGRILVLPLFALAIGAGDAAAQVTITNTASSTQSATVSVVGPANGPLATALQQLLVRPNGNAAVPLLAQVLGPGAVSQTATQSTQIFNTVGPATIPIGNGPGTINCSGAPAVWPAANCNFSGYGSFTVANATQNNDTNTHTAFATSVTLPANVVVSRWLTGDLHAGFQTTLIDEGASFTDTLLSRTHRGNRTSASAALPFAPDRPVTPGIDEALAYATKAPAPLTAALGGGWSVWFKGSYGQSSYGATATDFGYRSRADGIKVGAEYTKDEWLYGIGAEFGRNKVNQAITGDTGRIDSSRVGLYGAWQPGDWSFGGSAVVGLHSIDASRLDLLPTPLVSSYGAKTIDLSGEASRQFALGGGVIEPFAGVLYTSLHSDAFVESGNILAVAGSATSIDAFKAYVGARASTSFTFADRWEVSPELRARLSYDVLDDTRGFTARFVNDPTATPITVAGLQPERTAVLLGAGLTSQLAANLRGLLAYDVELRGRDVSQLFTGGLSLRW